MNDLIRAAIGTNQTKTNDALDVMMKTFYFVFPYSAALCLLKELTEFCTSVGGKEIQ